MILNKLTGKLASKLSKRADEIDTPDNLILALDVGTECVKTLLARIDGEQITVLGIGRQQQQPNDMHAGAIADIANVVKNCEAAVSEAESQAGMQASKVVMGIAGELVKGITHTIRYRRPQPDKVLDEAEMDFIIDKVQERALEKAQRQIALETGNDNVEVKLVNSALVGIHIDGYKVSNPLGFQGRDVAIQIYTACAPMVHIGALESVAQELNLDLIAVSAEPFAVSRSVIGDDSASHFSSVLIDVGGGTTDIAIVNDGGVEGTKMFGIGGRSFTKNLANQLNLGYKEAEKLKLNLDDERIKQTLKQDAFRVIDKTLQIWLSGVELALSEFDSIDQLPNQILLCGGGSSLIGLVGKLSDHVWADNLPFTKQPTVKHISLKDVVGVKDETDELNDHTLITAVGLLRVGCDTIQVETDEITGLKEKINKFLRI
ncbi:MAG: cell division FtsA domain-containing protein [Candidatus Saccharibacteria bacterium]|nr:cell division FtsA domain-containing protein [Candidatus Saccharibacteria bacterium]